MAHVTSSALFQISAFCDSGVVLSLGCKEILALPRSWSTSSISFSHELSICRVVYHTVFFPSVFIVLRFLTYIFLEAPPSWLRVSAVPCGGSVGAFWGQGRLCLFKERPAWQSTPNANTWILTPSLLDIEGCFLLEEDSIHCICHGALSLSLIGSKEGSETPILPSYLLQTYCIKLSMYQICKGSEIYPAVHFPKTWYGIKII